MNSFGKNRFKVYVTYPEVATDLLAFGDPVCLGTDASITIENTQEGIKYFPTINGTTVGDEVVSDGGTVELSVSKDKLTQGDNAVVLMASVGGCSAVPLENPVTIKTDNLYPVTTVGESKSCGEGQVTIVVEGAPSNGYYNWYESIDSATPIEGVSGAEYVTPVLNKTKT